MFCQLFIAFTLGKKVNLNQFHRCKKVEKHSHQNLVFIKFIHKKLVGFPSKQQLSKMKYNVCYFQHI